MARPLGTWYKHRWDNFQFELLKCYYVHIPSLQNNVLYKLKSAYLKKVEEVVVCMPIATGAYLATHESRNFRGDTPKKGTTPKLKFLKLIDMVKQIVRRGVNDPAESKSGLIFGLGLLFHCLFGYFYRKLWKILKTSGTNCWSNTPLNSNTCKRCKIIF